VARRALVVSKIAKNLGRIGLSWDKLFSACHRQGIWQYSTRELEEILRKLKKANPGERLEEILG